MALFSTLYKRSLQWAQHRHAERYLFGLSVAESSFFPVPPDVMLIPMALARPQRAWWLALLTTIASVLGGVLGWLLGVWALEALLPWIERLGYLPAYESAVADFQQWGIWIVFLAGFTPIPYKIFTITAGSLAMPLLPFVLASLVGRGGRFFLVAALMRWGGPRIAAMEEAWMERIGWTVVVLAIGIGIGVAAS